MVAASGIHVLRDLIVNVGTGYAVAVAFFATILALQFFFPGRSRQSFDALWRAVVYTAVFIPAGLVLTSPLRPLMPEPLFSGFRGWQGMVFAAFVGDFFYYWFHRAQHTIPPLWRLHSVHHSVEEMGAGAGYHHVSEAPLKFLCYSIPLTLVAPVENAVVFGIILGLHGNYIHSVTRLNFGRLAWVVADNRTHRIHHSRDPAHYNRNFGALTLLWDRMFGTAYFPDSEEWPEIGLDDRAEPQSVKEYLFPAIRPAEPRTTTLRQPR